MKRRAFLVLAGLAALWPRKARAADIHGPIIRQTGQVVQCPQVAIGWKVLASDPDRVTRTRAVLEDSTEGAGKHILFPDVLTKLNAEEKRELFAVIANWFIQKASERLGK